MSPSPSSRPTASTRRDSRACTAKRRRWRKLGDHAEHRHHPRRWRRRWPGWPEPALHRQPVHVRRRRRYARPAADDRTHTRDCEGRLQRTRARAQARRRASRPQARQRLARRRRHGGDRRLRARRRVRAVAADDARHARRHGGLHAAGAGAGRRGDAARRPLLARLHAVRADHRPAAVRRPTTRPP